MYIICKLSIQNGFSYFLQNIPIVQGKNVFWKPYVRECILHQEKKKRRRKNQKTKKDTQIPQERQTVQEGCISKLGIPKTLISLSISPG